LPDRRENLAGQVGAVNRNNVPRMLRNAPRFCGVVRC